MFCFQSRNLRYLYNIYVIHISSCMILEIYNWLSIIWLLIDRSIYYIQNDLGIVFYSLRRVFLITFKQESLFPIQTKGILIGFLSTSVLILCIYEQLRLWRYYGTHSLIASVKLKYIFPTRYVMLIIAIAWFYSILTSAMANASLNDLSIFHLSQRESSYYCFLDVCSLAVSVCKLRPFGCITSQLIRKRTKCVSMI